MPAHPPGSAAALQAEHTTGPSRQLAARAIACPQRAATGSRLSKPGRCGWIARTVTCAEPCAPVSQCPSPASSRISSAQGGQPLLGLVIERGHEQEVYDAAGGWWRLNQRAESEKYAVVVSAGSCTMAIAIKEWTKQGDRRAFTGDILGPGHPVHDKFVGGADPSESTSRFPVLYLSDPVDEATCRSGCGTSVTRGEWVVGHDQRAIHARIRDDFGGSVSRFIDWYDSHGPFATPS